MIRSTKRSNRLPVKLLIIIPAGKLISCFCDLLRSRKFCHRLIVIRRSRVTSSKRSSIFLIVNAGFLQHIRPLGRSFLRMHNRILRVRIFSKCRNRHRCCKQCHAQNHTDQTFLHMYYPSSFFLKNKCLYILYQKKYIPHMPVEGKKSAYFTLSL